MPDLPHQYQRQVNHLPYRKKIPSVDDAFPPSFDEETESQTISSDKTNHNSKKVKYEETFKQSSA